MEIGDWLRGLDLSQYEAAFRENSIDFDVLRKLTPEDLKDLGVISVGHRRRLLAAIEELSSAGIATSAVAQSAAAAMVEATAAERRYLTVMFVDLVGSTALAARLDPEDVRDVFAAYHKCCAGVIASNCGFVAKYMGDGVLAYFGYPQAHEQDAENAVRASLAIVAATPKLNTGAGAPLHVRVGVATGIVVVGDLLGSGEAQERGVVGDTPNLAARLQGIAEPDSVVIAEGTRELLGNLFELEDLGTKDLKGIARPARVWAALRASPVANHFEALHGMGLTPLVGREEECELLLRRWTKAKSGEGQVVLLSGEAGIGKSRLAAALLERLANEPHTRLRYSCAALHTDDALYPIIDEMERAARLAHDDAPQAKLDKLGSLLAYTSTPAEDASLFAEMLSLKNDGRYPAVEFAPAQHRQRTLRALVAQIEALTRFRPVLIIFEDAHWSDPTSLEALSRIVDRIRTLRALMIVTFRPEFNAPWIGQSHVATLNINRLAQREVSVMIGNVAGDRPLPANIRRDIVERCDGVPLFVEEMTRAVLEADGDRATAAAAPAIRSPSLAVPATLQASLMARLDRLGSAREVAQIGAAIGREFPHGLLAAVARKPEDELRSSLDGLVQAGLLFRWGAPPNATYRFKHALVQDAAYGALLREPRRALHARIVETLESQFAEIADAQPALVARHCAEAGLIERSADLWGKAGQQSLERSALVEATEQLTRALGQIEALSATPLIRREQIKLQVALANALMIVRGYAAPETKTAEDRARLLIEQSQALGEQPPLALLSVLYGFWTASFIGFNGDACRELAGQILALAEQQKATVPVMIGHCVMGAALAATGEIAEGRAHCDQAIVLYDPVKHRPMVARLGQDFRALILTYRSIILWMLGYPDSALADADFALGDAHAIGHAATLMNTLTLTPLTYIYCGNYSTANAALGELATLADEKGAALDYKASKMALEGFMMGLTGRSSDAVKMITSGYAAFRSTGTTLLTPTFLSRLAGAYADIGQFDGASRCIDEAFTAVETTEERWWESEIHRMAGEIEQQSPKRSEAKAQVCFERALEVARSQQARSWELRAATSLARLWREQGRRAEAHDLLAPVYSWFTEGFDTLDLKEAKALLDELAS